MTSHYRIHKEGTISILVAFFIAFVPIWASSFFKAPLILQIIVTTVCVLFFALVVYFFRVPFRVTKRDSNAIIAPADGTIVQILEEVETEYFNDKRIKISIFMSPLNVHVNTYPIDGETVYVKYHPGKHFVASLPKASKDNEHNTVVQKHKNGEEILFRQIAGTVARRIVSYAKEGDNAVQGRETGIIKFGSRVDVFLPLSAKINVTLNQPVQSKITHLAYFS
ncbi:MAG: phosphatidylserine decarboxylase family protein [Bacteroidetes bacterium]|nr:phosphatidylserine decarboxylase family protein [Bacteroidota bacterium]MCL1968324.1 phosphatidylserine decarboxylase family protein [Bacteroidota bacterium]